MLKDRREAGLRLAQALQAYRGAPDALVLVLPRGGVVVGYEVAKALKLPLDIVVPRKIGAPGNPEYAIGAITETGEAIFNDDEVRHADKKWLARIMEEEKQEAQRRLTTYRKGSPTSVAGKTVILVDDGIATGYTMRAAIASIKARKPAKVVVAVPHGAADSIAQIRAETDEVVALEIPPVYLAVGAHYENFSPVGDTEVIELLAQAAKRALTAPHL